MGYAQPESRDQVTLDNRVDLCLSENGNANRALTNSMHGIFAGWTLSFLKDSLGYAAFFATFEYIKAQAYYGFISIYYGQSRQNNQNTVLRPGMGELYSGRVLRPHYAIEPVFIMLAGITASITQQTIQHPIGLIQSAHYKSLAAMDSKLQHKQSMRQLIHNYYGAYGKTYERCQALATEYGGWRRWLYRGFFWSTIKQVPSTSAGLIIFELVRRRYGLETEDVRINKDGYEILLA